MLVTLRSIRIIKVTFFTHQIVELSSLLIVLCLVFPCKVQPGNVVLMETWPYQYIGEPVSTSDDRNLGQGPYRVLSDSVLSVSVTFSVCLLTFFVLYIVRGHAYAA